MLSNNKAGSISGADPMFLLRQGQVKREEQRTHRGLMRMLICGTQSDLTKIKVSCRQRRARTLLASHIPEFDM
jgi:hypothetical protein